MAGVPLPIVSQPLQACVTELIEPFLNYVIVSSNLHVYVSQTAKGELVIGSEVDPYQTYCTRSTLPDAGADGHLYFGVVPPTARPEDSSPVGRGV
jgi:glycine/D-amino acid oxidase-like deaminating enzyme